ncbi:hypothetical protein MHAE_01890 [Mycobacterium haemophilum DSM 44634]|uniref:DUF4262 domain-containing protein n=1 Tax=Mycobacterium haemophilum TaxID=29311 RepID=UPI0006552723|nr:DUF4262 domain-containing protein [Mycobacterium haemophilum]AKN17021.1 hypothetical protein B586_11410 [Mycobacterium haemophilum DSM 44634]MCV7340449.1 DUF4262 domain-containing protein [Mycobacterium haemophilum DSM 44634]
MCWICDRPGSTKDDYLDHLRATIRRRGWAVQYVESDRVPYAYTLGLTRHGLPEFLMTGISPQQAAQLLVGVARSAPGLRPPNPGERLSLSASTVVEVVEIEHPDAHMDSAIAIYGSKVTALQLVWADRHGRWPWAPGFNDGRSVQPVLGARASPNS